jgi:hypothetical protein
MQNQTQELLNQQTATSTYAATKMLDLRVSDRSVNLPYNFRAPPGPHRIVGIPHRIVGAINLCGDSITTLSLR